MKKFNLFYFVLFFTWSSVYTLITLYMNEIVGLSLSSIGLIMSVLPLISLFFQPVWGGLSDFSGKRKAVLQLLLLANAGIAGIITLFTNNIAVVVIYFMYQLFLCGQGPLTDSMAIRYVGENPKSSFGFIRVWGSVGYAIGAIIVAGIANQLGLKWMFYMASIGYVASFLLTLGIKNNQVPIIKSHFKRDIKTLLKQKDYLFVLIYSFLMIGSFFGSDQYLGLYIRSNDMGLSTIGILTFISVCIEVPFIFNSKRLINTYGATRLLIFMNVVSIARMLLLGFSGTFFMFALAGVLRGVIVGIFVPIFIELICEITPHAVVTSAVAIYSAVSSGIANFVFTLVGGFIADQFGYEALFFSYALIMTLPLMLALKINKFKSVQS
ncbi:MAG TPA: MFS transporter [Fusibacter sp.]|nr:MFS transporter [Fusibacter sp.]